MGSLKDGEFLSIVLRSVYLRANRIFFLVITELAKILSV